MEIWRRRIKGMMVVLAVLLFALTGCSDDMTPDGENKKGLSSYNEGDYASAKTFFERAINMDSETKEYHNNLGMTLIQMEDYSEAIAQFEFVIVDDPSKLEDKRLTKFAWRGEGMAYLQRQDFEEALVCFNKALEIDVESDWDVDILYYKANTLECMGYPTSAIENYTAVLDKKKDNESALLARANLYREEGEYEDAIDDYKRVLKEYEGSYEAYVGLYACYFETGDLDKGADLLQQATYLEVKTDEDKYRLGQIHFYQGNYESAQIEMENAVKNGYVEGYYFLGEIALSNKEYETALTYYEQYRASKVIESPTVCNQEIVCYLALFDYENAQKMLDLGLAYEGSPAYQKLLRNQVALYEGRTEYTKAYEALQEYIVKFPEDTEATDEYRFLKKLLQIDQTNE